jgi:hypothetical protein
MHVQWLILKSEHESVVEYDTEMWIEYFIVSAN